MERNTSEAAHEASEGCIGLRVIHGSPTPSQRQQTPATAGSMVETWREDWREGGEGGRGGTTGNPAGCTIIITLFWGGPISTQFTHMETDHQRLHLLRFCERSGCFEVHFLTVPRSWPHSGLAGSPPPLTPKTWGLQGGGRGLTGGVSHLMQGQDAVLQLAVLPAQTLRASLWLPCVQIGFATGAFPRLPTPPGFGCTSEKLKPAKNIAKAKTKKHAMLRRQTRPHPSTAASCKPQQ